MQQNSKRLKIIALVVSILFCTSLLAQVVSRDAVGDRPSPISSNALAVLTLASIFLSAYGFAAAWFFEFRRATLLDRFSKRRSWLSPEANFLLICHLLLVSPAFYGLFLYYCGMPLSETLYFAGAAILMALAWGLYDLRKI